MLRYRADRRTLAILTAYAALVALQWVFAPRGLLGVALLAVTCINSWLCAVIAHNTVHTPVFKKRSLNKLFQVWVSCSYGFPISDYVPGHNLSHHRYNQLPQDVMRTDKVRFRWNLLNLIFFFPAVTPGILRGNARYWKVLGRGSNAWKRQLLLESAVVWGIKLAVLLIDWRKGLLYVVVPHLFANFGIVSINFLQHDGCDEAHPVNHSRNFVGRWLNFFAVNNGYHGIHHLVPGLHWSLLPEAHAAQVRPLLHPALDEPSLPAYMFRTFIYPGKRLTFEGKPVVRPAVPDRDWVQPGDGEAQEEPGLTADRLAA